MIKIQGQNSTFSKTDEYFRGKMAKLPKNVQFLSLKKCLEFKVKSPKFPKRPKFQQKNNPQFQKMSIFSVKKFNMSITVKHFSEKPPIFP